MSMNRNFLDPRAAAFASGARPRQVQDAKVTQQAIDERAAKRGIDPPPYEFLELIGKGSYGRVYKSRSRNNQQICAVKIIESDSQDYNTQDFFNRDDDTIRDFLKETNMLQTLKEHGAQNVNLIHEAFSFDSQLWIVSDYCPGGGLSTLMKAVPNKQLAEKYIIPIAREVLVALKGIHGANIIHRDVKCANILVTEDGRIQLCDFGISAMLENGVSKRSTIVGTPHWMPPELIEYLGTAAAFVQYGTEIDIWSFGCAVHEMATGLPPNAKVRVHELGQWLRNNDTGLAGGNWSPELRDFVSVCLRTDPGTRPSAADLLEHPYIADTSDTYPASIISELVEDYAMWEQSGGQRTSLFNGFGAPAADPLSPGSAAGEDWNFSTTVEFDKRMSMRLDPDQVPLTARSLHPFDQFVEDQRIERGAMQLGRIFDLNSNGYGKRVSDLPLRNLQNAPAADRTTMIDLDAAIPDFGDAPSINLDMPDVPTIRSKRMTRAQDDYGDEEETMNASKYNSTMLSLEPPSSHDDVNMNRRTQDWKFPWSMADQQARNSLAPPAPPKNDRMNRKTQDWKFLTAEEFTYAAQSVDDSSSPDDYSESFGSSRPSLRQSETMPTIRTRVDSPDRGSMIDLDIAIIPSTRPGTASSAATSALSDFSQNPFDLDDQFNMTMTSSNRASSHIKSISEPTAAFNRTGTGSLMSPISDRDYGSEPESDVGGTIRAGPPSATIPSSNSNNGSLRPNGPGGKGRSQSQTSMTSTSTRSYATAQESFGTNGMSSSLYASSSMRSERASEVFALPPTFVPDFSVINDPMADPERMEMEFGRLLDNLLLQTEAMMRMTQ